MVNQRNSSFDVLRILATLYVIYMHVANFASMEFRKKLPFFPVSIIILAKTCNFTFMLISSYFLSIKGYKFSKTIPLIVQTSSCTVFVYFTKTWWYKHEKFNFYTLWKFLTPIMHDIHWYPLPFLFTSFIFSLLYPTLKKSGKKFHKIAIICGCILYIGTREFLFLQLEWYYTDHFSIFYLAMLFASYFKFYGLNVSWNFLFPFTIIVYFVNYYLHNYDIPYPHNYFGYGNLSFNRLMSFQSFLLSIAFFMIFSKIKIYKFQIIFQTLSELSFGEYLIACPHITFYQKSWIKAKKFSSHYRLFTKFSIIALIKTFIVCAFLEYTRAKIVKTLVFHRKFYLKLQDTIDK